VSKAKQRLDDAMWRELEQHRFDESGLISRDDLEEDDDFAVYDDGWPFDDLDDFDPHDEEVQPQMEEEFDFPIAIWIGPFSPEIGGFWLWV
jgi:hypothetical protein